MLEVEGLVRLVGEVVVLELQLVEASVIVSNRQYDFETSSTRLRRLPRLLLFS